MNKTIIINMNGTIFHIEEDAYDILKNYMTGIKKHFAGTDDSFEITTDIENRIAEMFTELLKKDGKQVIVTTDVTSVILQMGTIEDFSTEEQEPVFASRAGDTSANRSLFRDPEDHLIGGVAAGIANYFGIDAVWVRLAFVITLFGAGSGFLIYIILWALIPRANTRAERMAMKGERADLQGFKRNFDEELKNIKQSLSNANREARPFIYKIRDFIGEFLLLLQRFFKGGGKILLKLIGLMIIIACACAIIGLLVSIVVFSANQSMFVHRFSPFNIVDYRFNNILYVCGFLVCAIPLFGLILFTIRIVFSRNVLGRSIGFILLIGWIAALSTVAFYATKIASDFRYTASFNQKMDIMPTPNQHYFLKINTAKILTKEDSLTLGIKKNDFANRIIVNMNNENDTDISPENVSLFIQKSENKFPSLVESYRSKGANYQEALLNARNTQYNFMQEDSVIKFDRKLIPINKAVWRDQKLDVTLNLPLNSIITIDESLDYILRDVDLYSCYNDDKNWGHRLAKFKMTETGLVCLKDSTQNKEGLK
ncbi:PspC domain-containing protein [Mucilaginibacter arboris]|uniref:PspC domain-containing protein n=1 Tax=Mucilaginibacter arboris TaxID=2682090 RepID=A0A7K1SSE4_9SPHI|nr:PspC domain-containing protein [Mucilaginibacter arboris]MVN20221.1 PspC domain-containing protein [Mucilaginibacter arboris]